MQARHFAECQRPLPRAVKSLYRKRRLPGRNYSRVYDWIWRCHHSANLRSVDSKVYSPRERAPLVHLGAHELPELLGRIADELRALHQHELAELGILEDSRNLLAEPRDDLLRCPCRREQPVPLVGLVIGESHLPDRLHVAQHRYAQSVIYRQRNYA